LLLHDAAERINRLTALNLGRLVDLTAGLWPLAAPVLSAAERFLQVL
jgi:hypothetical protein